MSVCDLYRELGEELAAGHVAAVVSDYAAGGNVSKRLLSSGDQAAWAQAMREWSGISAQVDGPVMCIAGEDGAMTTIEVYRPKPRMIILGAGHIAAAIAPFAGQLGFELVVYDDRPSFVNRERFPDASELICDSFERLFERIRLRSADYVIIVTRGHRHDADCLRGILTGEEPAYTGMIGSKRRVAIVMDTLRQEGRDAQRIARIHSPIGLRIGAVTPAEIAISIMAEVVQCKRLGGGEAEAADVAAGFANQLSCDIEAVDAIVSRDGGFDAMVTIYNTEGSVPIETGAKLAMTYSGEIAGTIGGGCSEGEAMQIAREVINTGGWRTHTVDMTESAEDEGMVCGGLMRVVIEKI